MNEIVKPAALCVRCGGRMFLEETRQSCKACAETGATTCGDCWVVREWDCINCGYVVDLPRVRRRLVDTS